MSQEKELHEVVPSPLTNAPVHLRHHSYIPHWLAPPDSVWRVYPVWDVEVVPQVYWCMSQEEELPEVVPEVEWWVL